MRLCEDQLVTSVSSLFVIAHISDDSPVVIVLRGNQLRKKILS